jgi:hypothetical protein
MYGARGIAMCDRWRDDFYAFLADMGKRPSKAHTVDRIDNDKGYSPDNCRWATMVEQGQNKKNCIPTAGFPSLADAARAAGLNPNRLSARLRAGWPEHLLNLPPQKLGHRPHLIPLKRAADAVRHE